MSSEKERRGLLSTVPLTFSFIPLSAIDEDQSIRQAAAAFNRGTLHSGSHKLLKEWLSDTANQETSQLEYVF
jgi:hypothetical protein